MVHMGDQTLKHAILINNATCSCENKQSWQSSKGESLLIKHLNSFHTATTIWSTDYRVRRKIIGLNFARYRIKKLSWEALSVSFIQPTAIIKMLPLSLIQNCHLREILTNFTRFELNRAGLFRQFLIDRHLTQLDYKLYDVGNSISFKSYNRLSVVERTYVRTYESRRKPQLCEWSSRRIMYLGRKDPWWEQHARSESIKMWKAGGMEALY